MRLLLLSCGLSAVVKPANARPMRVARLADIKFASTFSRSATSSASVTSSVRPCFTSARVFRPMLMQRLVRPLSQRAPLPVSCDSTPPTPEPVLSFNPADDQTLPYRILAFYIVAPVENPTSLMSDYRKFLEKRGMVGRVYVCEEGLNVQVSGTTADCAEYRELVAQAFRGQQILFKEDPIAELAFPKLKVKHKPLVPKLQSGDIDLNNRGQDLTPEEWATMLADNTKPKVILDVRNGYEWDLGRFEGAERPSLDHFTETDEAAYKLPTDEHDKEETPVMMYCTGGIRCEIFSAKLKASGFKHVYKLQGGVQHYGNTFAAKQKAQAPAGATAKESVRDGAGAGDHGGTTAAPVSSDAKKEEQEQAAASAAAALKSSSKDAQGSVSPFWKGSLFVFDRRNKMDMGSDEVVGTCLHCGGATDAIFNCGNVDCNKMHLVCHNCLPQSQGYCSQECSVAPRRRPLPLADLLAEGQVTAEVVASLTQGPPPGMRDPNKLSTTKPHCIPRKDFNADIHGFQ